MKPFFTVLLLFIFCRVAIAQSLQGATPLVPSDGDTIKDASSLVFSWANAPGSTNQQSFSLYQVLPNQSPLLAAQSNQPFFIEQSITSSALVYPPYARRLATGWYAWHLVNTSQIVQGDKRYPVNVGSEVRSFYYAGETPGCLLDFNKDSTSFYLVELSHQLQVSAKQLNKGGQIKKADCSLMRNDGAVITSFWLDLRESTPIIDLPRLLSKKDVREAGGTIILVAKTGGQVRKLKLVFDL